MQSNIQGYQDIYLPSTDLGFEPLYLKKIGEGEYIPINEDVDIFREEANQGFVNLFYWHLNRSIDCFIFTLKRGWPK
ncbi:hypothetical protein HMSSN036_93360 [Paenibacillus macerans]|nr:hypothetical protein HMSSN036_93360 [Paenibacillus macerans]